MVSLCFYFSLNISLIINNFNFIFAIKKTV